MLYTIICHKLAYYNIIYIYIYIYIILREGSSALFRALAHTHAQASAGAAERTKREKNIKYGQGTSATADEALERQNEKEQSINRLINNCTSKL